MEWISVSDRLPIVPEQVLVTDGYDIKRSQINYNASGTAYFMLEETDFMVIWWAPFSDTALADNLEYYTEHRRNIYDVDTKQQ